MTHAKTRAFENKSEIVGNADKSNAKNNEAYDMGVLMLLTLLSSSADGKVFLRAERHNKAACAKDGLFLQFGKERSRFDSGVLTRY